MKEIKQNERTENGNKTQFMHTLCLFYHNHWVVLGGLWEPSSRSRSWRPL